ncbi:ESPR-type extended signal peptide-containing protein, partial [Burkholderia cenocepacia]|nr:ESPR-type extended signal peptide-containing protein [Burkholderia cenocepacia]
MWTKTVPSFFSLNEASNMNKSYRTVWNASTGTWAAAAETTRTRSKGSLNTRRKTLAVVAAGMASFALPQAGAVFAAEADGTTVISEDVETTKPGDGDHDIAMAPEASPAGRAAVANIAATDTVSPAIETGGRILERQIATAGTPVSGADTIQSGGMIGIMTSGDTVLNVNTSGSALPTPVATNPYDVALGQGAVATGPDAGFIPATALGTRANAIGAGTAAVGYRSAASADYAVAMGYQASAVTNSSIAIGNGAAATADGAAGAGSSVAIGTTARASAISSAALGQGASALSDRSSAIGAGTTASGRGSVALGSGATARSGSDGGNIAIGENATAENASGGYGTIAIGAGARAGSGGFSGGMALGVAAASNRANIAIGNNANAVGATGGINGLLALGNNASATANSSIALGNASVADRQNSLSIGRAGAERQITNVAAGTQNTDAVTVSQLSGVVGALGGGAKVNPNGSIEAPTYNVGGKDVRNIGDAVSNLDGRVTGNTGAIADLADQMKNSGLVDPTTGAAIAAVTYDNATKASVTLGGAGATTPVTVKNVANGVDGSDAVNVSQLTDATQSIRDDLASGALDMRYIKVNATGVQANAAGTNAVAIGSGANANGAGALALGTGARAQGVNAVALGFNSVATQANTVSVGRAGNERKIVNVAQGDVSADSTDAINGAQLYDALNSLTTTLDEKTKNLASNGANSMGIMGANAGIMDVTAPLVAVEGLQGNNTASLNGADAATTTAVAIGSSSVAAGGNTVAVGLQNVAGSNNAVAIGSFAQTGADSDYATAIGSNVQATGSEAVAMGANVEAGADNALVIGSNNARAIGAGSVALGNNARVNGGAANSIAVGTNAAVATNVSNALALGAGATVAAGSTGGVALGQGSVANRGNAVSVGGGTVGQRQIINVAAGTGTTDAVNVGQLSSVTSALGGGAAVAANGTVTQPTYKVDGKDYGNVGDALAALDGKSGSGTDPNAVSYDDATKGTVTLGGTGATAPVALKNVADGVDDHDAVNVSQLKTAGLVGDDGSGNLTSLAVAYDDATKSSVTLGGTGATAPVALKNVADGVDDHDAVNVSQLKTTGLVGDDGSGNLTSLAVGYDDATKSKVTLAGGTTGTTITNVAAGTVGATSTDAINGSQLYGTAQSVADALGGGATVGADGKVEAPTYTVGGTDVRTVGDAISNLDGRTTTNTGDISDLKDKLADSGLVDPTTGKAIAAVTYDDATKSSVTLGGTSATAPVALKNVADGVDDHDAVNVSQLKTTGLVGDDGSGNLTSLAVGYDDATKSKVTLAGGTTGTTITNVAAGTVGATSTDAINGSQLYGTAQSVADALGGGATVGADGKVEAPTYTVGGTDVRTVGDAISNLDGRTTTNAGDISDLKDKLADSGLVDPTTGKAIAAVTYDDATKSSVTLGGTGATAPVALKNVADGVDDHDAVNVSQLKTTGLVGDDGSGNLTSLAVAYDDATKSSVTLGGTGATAPVALKNVADGVDDHDAVNVSQLKTTGLVGDDGSGNLTSL